MLSARRGRAAARPRAGRRRAAARLEQPLALGDVQARALAARFAARQLALAAHERQRDMGVADEAHAMILLIEAELGEQRREHVLPDRIPRARAMEADG